MKIQASGFMHLRILCERIEYLYGVLPVTPISDQQTSIILADYVQRENQRGTTSAHDKVKAVEIFLQFLKYEISRLREKNPFFNPTLSGAVYVCKAMEQAIQRFYKRNAQITDQNQLDLI